MTHTFSVIASVVIFNADLRHEILSRSRAQIILQRPGRRNPMRRIKRRSSQLLPLGTEIAPAAPNFRRTILRTGRAALRIR